MQFSQDFSQGLKDGLPIALGYFAVSFAFGAIALNYGLTTLQSTLLSASNLTSAGQFAGTQLISAGARLTEIILTVSIINARYFLMSLSLSQKLDPSVSLKGRFLISFGVTDEIFMVASLNKKSVTTFYFSGLMLLPILGWTAGTYFGSAATELLPESIAAALGIALYGMFIALLVPAIRSEQAARITVLIAIAASLTLHVSPVFSFLSAGWKITICTVLGAAVAAHLFPQEEVSP